MSKPEDNNVYDKDGKKIGTKPKVFMDAKQYREWKERFREAVAPELEKQRIQRLRSIEAAMNHWIGPKR